MFVRSFGTCVVLLFSAISMSESKYAFITWEGDKAVITETKFYSEIPKLHVARATYSNEINSTGWAFLELHTTFSSDEQQAYSAGYLEGYLTRDLIFMHWENMIKGYCYNKTDLCGLIEEYVDKNEEYIAEMLKNYPNDPYWYQLKLYYIQIDGLAMGYNEATKNPYQKLSLREIIWINMLGDLDELSVALSLPPDTPDLFGAHCTGLVKLLPDLSELYVAQTTWNSYQSMIRIQKMYVLNYRLFPDSTELLPGRKMSMSSYPAMVQSMDDFYVISSGLVVAETTIGNNNRYLFKHVTPVGQIMEYARAMIANRMARDGKEWVGIFRKYNSGTYNNQWYIVDYNKFQRSRNTVPGVLRPGTLWVLEQLPSYIEAADLTEKLKQDTYFPSYNIAYFPRVFNISGGNMRVDMFGDWFGYHTHPRAKIIKEKQSEITNLREMFYTMRYNNYMRDPLARCETCSPQYSAMNAIAARGDLNPANGTYPFQAMGHRNHGATDAKVTSSRLYPSYQFLAVSSPPHNISRGIPPFQWSHFDLGSRISHVGHPDTWVFPPLLHTWEWQ